MRIGIAVLSYVMPCNYWLSANTAKNGAAAIYLDKKKRVSRKYWYTYTTVHVVRVRTAVLQILVEY